MSGLAGSLIARMLAQRDLLQEFADRSSALFVYTASPDELVSVEVDGLGSMTGLWLDPDAPALDPDALAKLIVDTAVVAARDAQDRQDALLNELNDRIHALQETPLTRWDGTTVEAP
jgi:DNA-binding protein YbaB